MILRQYIPSFIETESAPLVLEIETLEALLAQEFVRRFQREPNFHRFSIERGYYPQEKLSLLMAEYQAGKSWWVVAYLEGDITPLASLPAFEPEHKIRAG